MRNLTTDDLKAFEDRLLVLNPGGRHAWGMGRNIARLLVAVDEEWPGRVPPAVRQRTRFQTLANPRPSPREPFSPFVADQLRRVCLTDMKAVTARLRDGTELLAQGVDPEVGGWDKVANVMCAIDASRGTLISGALASRAHHALPAPFPEIAARLYPSAQDLLPFLVMLGLQSGLPIECVTSLRRDCLRNPAGATVQIDHEKWRAGPSPFRSKRYPDAGLRTPGGIVRTVSRPTFHQEAKRLVRRAPPLVDDGGAPLVLRLSRLRKTRMTEWARQVKGDPEALSRLGDHTLQVNWESYADVEAMRPIYEETIAAGLGYALDSADRAAKAGWSLRKTRRIVNDIVPAFGTAAWHRARKAASTQGPLRALPTGVLDG